MQSRRQFMFKIVPAIAVGGLVAREAFAPASDVRQLRALSGQAGRCVRQLRHIPGQAGCGQGLVQCVGEKGLITCAMVL